MPRSSHGEISMRHFPDLSDDVSFQIPAAHDDNLLVGDAPGDLGLNFDAFDDGEMGGLDDDPFVTPMPKSKKHAPLTLSELTPRGARADAGPSSRFDSATISKREESREKENQSRKPNQPSVRLALPKKQSVDDMFERRKRDNYQQMGIDLTSRSTARLRDDKEKTAGMTEVRGGAKIRTNGPEIAKVLPTQDGHGTRGNATKAKMKRPILAKDAGIAKHKPRAPPSAQTQPKSILKPSKRAAVLPPSKLARTLTTLSHTPKAERPRWGDVVAEVQHTSHGRESSGSGTGIMGGGLIDVLVMYGEKLKGSLGFSSSSGKASPVQGTSSNDTPAIPITGMHRSTRNHLEDPSHIHNAAGPSSKPLTMSDLSPPKAEARHSKDVLTLSDLSPSKPMAGSEADGESDTDVPHRAEVSPLRPSRKRTSSGTPSRERKKGKAEPDQQPKRAESSSSSKINAEARGPVVTKVVSKPKPLGLSHAVNGAQKNGPHPRPRTNPPSSTSVAVPTKPRPGASSQDMKGKSKQVSSAATHSRRPADKEQRAPTDMAMPPGPVFASDVYRHRALEKTHRERDARQEKEKEKRAFKAGAMPCFSKPAPPARPAIRPTVPAAFTFQSDARAAHRNAEFEEKRKTWESRVTHQALPMPDFAAMHAVEAEVARNRRVVPVLPTDAPPLTTTIRAREREKFDEERREREKAIERLKEERERERAEQDEKAYREARKKAVPRAHEVPEWYKDMPKRKEVE